MKDFVIDLIGYNFIPKRRELKQKEKTEQNHFFIIDINGGYFVRKTKYGYKYSYSKESYSVKKFATEKDALKYIEKMKDWLSDRYSPIVKKVNGIAYF